MALVVAVDAISIRVLVKQFQQLSTAHSFACVELNIVKISKPNRKGHRIEPIRNLFVRLTVLDFLAALRFLKHKILGLKPPATSLIFTLDFWPGTKLTQPVTSQGCFGRAKMAAIFCLTSQLRVAKNVDNFSLTQSPSTTQTQKRLTLPPPPPPPPRSSTHEHKMSNFNF